MDNNIIYSPFELEIAEMESLALVNIEKDPDKVYVGFEPQSFISKEFGWGLRILAYRVDGYVDVYQEKKIPRDENDNINAAGKGLGDFVHIDMTKREFEINDYGVNLNIEFIDKLGRMLIIKIREDQSRKTKPFSLLAPVGVSSENPVALPVFFMYGFYFIRQKGTEVLIKIGDRKHKLDKFIRMNGEKLYFARYGRKTSIGEWNKARDGLAKELKVINNKATDSNGVEYDLEMIDDTNYINSMKLGHAGDEIKVKFNPAIKDIRKIKNGEQCQGSFIISGHESIGTIEGIYNFIGKENSLEVTAIPNKGWIPNEKSIMLRIIFFMARVFKKWPKTYKWSATIDFKDINNPTISSKWERIK